jgi:hypothetical protein
MSVRIKKFKSKNIDINSDYTNTNTVYDDINKIITTTQYYYKGWTPLMFACENGNLDLVSFLLEKGADPKIHPPYMSPFRCAIKYKDMIKLFMNHKIYV